MGSNFFDIPFRSKSSDSDFLCKDGELDSGGQSAEFNVPNAECPVPDVDFAVVRSQLPGWNVLAKDLPARGVMASPPSMEYWTSVAAGLLRQFQNEATGCNLFVAPFYAMAAWKTYSGEYLNPTAPVKLIPNSEVPLVATNDDVKSDEIEMKLTAAVGELYFRMRAPEILRDYVGKIRSLEILVSRPLQSYDTFGAFLPFKRISTASFCRCLDLSTGEISDEKICSLTFPLAWKANLNGMPVSIDGDIQIEKELKFYPFCSVPLGEVDIHDEWKPAEAPAGIEGWSPSISYGEILNGGSDEKSVPIIVRGENKEIDIITRPLKLSGAGKLKRVRRVSLRGDYTPENITIRVYGSRDMLDWWLISQIKEGTMAVLPRSSFRFYKVGISGFLAVSESLQGIQVSSS